MDYKLSVPIILFIRPIFYSFRYYCISVVVLVYYGLLELSLLLLSKLITQITVLCSIRRLIFKF